MAKLTLSRRCLPSVARLLLTLSGAVVVAPQAAHAVGEQNGRIAGVITDKLSQSPLPGARVSVKSGALIGGPRSVLTGEDGSYEINALPPGTYQVELNFEGAKPLRRRVVVLQGETFPLNIEWSVELAAEDKKIIVEERRMTRPDTTQTGTVLTADTQGRVATRRTYQTITQQAAGVSFSAGQGNPNIKGAMDSHNRYLVDGLDITDPVTNTFSANINFDSIASVEVLTGGAEAQYNTLGGVINLITNAGGNEWHLDSSLYVNHQTLSAGSQFGDQLYLGVRPFARLDRSPNASYQANFNLGGPLVKNKLWLALSFEYKRDETSLNIGPPFYLQHPPLLANRYLARIKLTWAPTERHRVTLSASTDPASFDNANQDPYRLAVAENRQNQGGVFTILQWDYFISDKVNTNLQAGFQYSTIDFGPQGYYGTIDPSAYRGTGRFSTANDTWLADRPQQRNNDDGTTWYQGGAIVPDARYTVQFDPSVSVRGNLAGKHEAKFGIQSRWNYHTASVTTPGGMTFSNQGGGPGEAGLCLPEQNRTAGCSLRTDTPAYENHQSGFSIGGFVQDRWQVTKWLRINPGFRLDYGRSENSIGQVVSNLLGFGPRLGLVFDLTQDQKTIFTAYYGRANEVLSLLAASYADVAATSTVYRYNHGTNMWDKRNTTGGIDGYRVEADYADPTRNQVLRGLDNLRDREPPHTDEITLSFRREVFENSAAGVDYTYKRVGNIWDNIEVNQIWDPTGTRVIDHVNGQSQLIYLYARPDENWRVYQGVDFTLESRPRQEWDFSVVYTLSWLYGPGAEQFAQVSGYQSLSQFYNRRLFGNYDGFLPEDHRHNLKVRASYTLKGFTIGAFMNYLTGAPLTKLYYNQNEGDYTNRRSATGTAPSMPNSVAAVSELRLPDVLTMDTRISYDLQSVLKKVHLTLIADIFNLFNLNAALPLSSSQGIEYRDVPTFGQVTSRQPPLRVQLGLRLQY